MTEETDASNYSSLRYFRNTRNICCGHYRQLRDCRWSNSLVGGAHSHRHLHHHRTLHLVRTLLIRASLGPLLTGFLGTILVLRAKAGDRWLGWKQYISTAYAVSVNSN